MTISLNDRSLITSYIQIILRDFSGLSVKAPDDSGSKYTDDWYEVTSSSPIRVTGTYDLDTYAAASMFMIVNYPNEQFPVRYDVVNSTVVETPFDKSKLNETIKWIKTWYVRNIDEDIYNSNSPDTSKIFDWTTLSRYFVSIDRLEDLLDDKSTGFDQIVRESSLSFIVHNMNLSLEMKNVVDLPERVLSYFFDEVVTPSSSRDEIYRIQKKIFLNSELSKTNYGLFTEEMSDRVRKIQSEFIKVHTADEGSVSLPEGFEGFKVTGYVDPWTEMIIDGGVR